MTRPNFPPLYPPRMLTKQQIRQQDRRAGKTHILKCLICEKDFDSLDKKHDDERLDVCYCSFQCWGKSLDSIHAEIEYRRTHRYG